QATPTTTISLSLPDQYGLYHADGQILDGVFVYASFEMSRMGHAGVSCMDCHEPPSNPISTGLGITYPSPTNRLAVTKMPPVRCKKHGACSRPLDLSSKPTLHA
ncbi:MAG: hypothetical protein AAGC73_10085, partial [Verrucomicrobiota bacterium]